MATKEEIKCTVENFQKMRELIYKVDPTAQFNVSGIVVNGKTLNIKIGDILILEDGVLSIEKQHK